MRLPHLVYHMLVFFYIAYYIFDCVSGRVGVVSGYCQFARPRRQTRYIWSLVNTKASRQHVHQGNQNPQHRRRQARPQPVLSQRIGDKVRQRTLPRHRLSDGAQELEGGCRRSATPRPPAAVRSRVQAAGHRQQGPGGSAPTLRRKTHANCDRQPRQPREPAPGRLPVPRDAISASRPRECADRRQDDPPASAGCAMTARPRSFWSARRARRCTASATCVTGPPGAVQPRARAASPIPSPFTTCSRPRRRQASPLRALEAQRLPHACAARAFRAVARSCGAT